MLTGNKGEWSEIYTLFKLLGDKQLIPGNQHLNQLESIIHPILTIFRSESGKEINYSVNDNLVIVSADKEILKVPINTFKKQASTLFQSIKSNIKGTFALPETEEFMRTIHCLSLKAKSSTKTDITIQIHDQKTNQQPTLGFSIKSQLGNPSTLLNAGKTTNFLYKITNLDLSETEIDEINSINSRKKIIDRIKAITNKGGQLNFHSTENQVFSNNLILIDSSLPSILAHMVYQFYTTKQSKMVDLLSSIKNQNPLNYDISHHHQFYEYKVKRFLTDIALGMMPSQVWSGNYDATGGYLIVKNDGDIVCYHVYHRTDFENYLLNNTKLDTASSKRYKFGEIYKQNDALFFKLNLQVRFIK